jgi:hypothetical protein
MATVTLPPFELTDTDLDALSMLLEDYIDHSLALTRELRQYRHCSNASEFIHKRIDLAYSLLERIENR